MFAAVFWGSSWSTCPFVLQTTLVSSTLLKEMATEMFESLVDEGRSSVKMSAAVLWSSSWLICPFVLQTTLVGSTILEETAIELVFEPLAEEGRSVTPKAAVFWGSSWSTCPFVLLSSLVGSTLFGKTATELVFNVASSQLPTKNSITSLLPRKSWQFSSILFNMLTVTSNCSTELCCWSSLTSTNAFSLTQSEAAAYILTVYVSIPCRVIACSRPLHADTLIVSHVYL